MSFPAPMSAFPTPLPKMLTPNDGRGILLPAHTLLTSVCALMMCVGGCSSRQKLETILISDGCVVYVEKASAEEAKSIMETWQLSEDCEIKTKSDLE